MSVATTPPVTSLAAELSGSQPPRRSGGARLALLEDKLDNVWEGLRADGAAACPVCEGPMRFLHGSGHCLRCGSSLS